MRYLRLLGLQLRLSLATGMQYRWNFLIDWAVSTLWTTLGLVPLYVAFHERPPLAGWTMDSALVVAAWFTLLRALLDGAVSPSIVALVEHIRQGTLDFVLLKPADAQFLVSTTKFDISKGLDAIAAIAIFGVAFHRLGRMPSLGGVLLALVLFVCAAAVLYSVWIIVVSAAFWVVRLDNLAYLFSSIVDFARWPVTVFKGPFRILFTYVLPIGVMTTYPAEALLGTLAPRTAALSVVGSVALALLARGTWTRAVRHYSSASS